MRILCVATKSPWPPTDGGRLVLALTMQALVAAGHAVDLLAPVSPREFARAHAVGMPDGIGLHAVPSVPHSWIRAGAYALRHARALSVARHRHAAVEHALAAHIARQPPDLIHVEQLQALDNCAPAHATGVPLLLRMQNVESEIWRQTLAARLGSLAAWLPSGRLRGEEYDALHGVARTVALTEPDATLLRHIGGASAAPITTIAPAFPCELSAGPALAGAPAIVLAGSGGWWPNAQAARWCIDEVAPRLLRRLPGARLHVFGGKGVAAVNTVAHEAPAASITAFADGAIAAVPLFVGSGIRMRILEAWARGLPVVATSIAARGLHVEHGRELLLADTPNAFCAAIEQLAASAALRARLIEAGRAYLAARHDPAQTTHALATVYEQAIACA